MLIADDHPLVRDGLAGILRSQKDIKVVAEAINGEEACQLYDQLSPDVLMLDLRMPKMDGLQVITELMSSHVPKPRIIVLTTYESEEDIRQALSAGAKGYLVKEASRQEIGKLCGALPPENPCLQRRSPPNSRNRWLILHSRSVNSKSCSIWPMAESTRRSGKFSISARVQ